jgi:rhomboid protease GluP
MKQIGAKFRLIFIPFLVINLGLVIAYTFLHWLLFIQIGTIKINEIIVNLIAPMVAPWIPILIWLNPRIKLLNIARAKARNPLFGYSFVAWIAMVAPLVIAQSYIETATGKLTALDHISQIDSLPKTKYYALKHFYIDKRLVHIKTTFEVSGKYNENFDMYIYVPSPIFDKDNNADTTGPDLSLHGRPDRNAQMKPIAWLALKYQKTISNKLSTGEKQSEFKQFANESQQDFETKNLNDFTYLDRIGYSSDLRNYAKAVDTAKSAKPPIILSPINEAFEARNGNKLPWIFGSLGIGAVVFMIMLLFLPLTKGAEIAEAIEAGQTAGKAQSRKSSDLEDIKQFFLPRENYYITPILIDLNLAIFLLMAITSSSFISFDVPVLLKWGGNVRPYVLEGQYWRLLTNMFLHGGVMHVLFNMYALLFVGLFLEPVMGRTKYLVVYLVTGIAASIASIWWHPATVSVGASGAIFGMYGVFLALLTTKLFPKNLQKSFLASTAVFIGYNLLFGLTGGIDNAAHIGGLLSGIIIGYALYPSLKKERGLADEEKQPGELPKELDQKE